MADMNKLKDCMANLEEETIYEILKKLISESPALAADALKACQDGLGEVGDRFESGEYFIGDLLYSGDIMGNAAEILKPAMAAGSGAALGKIILCTVKDDIHDIGKGIVKSIMEASGFEVIDLGIDVPGAVIIDAVKAHDVKIVALSGVLTLALKSMETIVGEFKDAGIRDKVKIIIGGCPVTENACKVIGADNWSKSPQKGMEICRAWATA